MVAALVVWTPLEGAQWELTDGPYGGWVYDLLTTPDGALYAVIADSGVHRSDDGGVTWRHLSATPSGRGGRLGYGGGLLYSNAGGLAVSSDRGESWVPLSPPDGSNFLAADDLAVYSVTIEDWGSFLYRSLDGGATWTRVFNLTKWTSIGPVAFHGRDVYEPISIIR